MDAVFCLMCRHWMTFWHKALAGIQAATPFIPTLTLRYEDVCNNPEQAVQAVASMAALNITKPVPQVNCKAFMGKNLGFITPRQFEEVVKVSSEGCLFYETCKSRVCMRSRDLCCTQAWSAGDVNPPGRSHRSDSRRGSPLSACTHTPLW